MHYTDTLNQELSGTKAYEQTSEKEKSVINNHIFHNATRFAVSVNEDQERLPGYLRLGLSWFNWWVSFAPEFQCCDVFSLLEFRKRTARSHGIKKNGNCKRKSRVQKLANCTLRDLATKLDVHGRHCMLSYLSSLPISVLRSLDTEANKFYDRTNRLYDAALFTRCYTQHALRPVIDSKINHIRHFIKIPFINKGMGFIDLPSIFRDKSVQSSIPNYFKNCEVPIICYKYNKPIRGAIFNFNKLVSDLDIETCTPDS